MYNVFGKTIIIEIVEGKGYCALRQLLGADELKVRIDYYQKIHNLHFRILPIFKQSFCSKLLKILTTALVHAQVLFSYKILANICFRILYNVLISLL